MPFANELATFALCLVAGISFALAYWPLLRSLPANFRFVPLLQTATLPVLAFPLVIPPERLGFRALALVLGVELWFKMADFTRHITVSGNHRQLLPYQVCLNALLSNLTQPLNQIRQPLERGLLSTMPSVDCFGRGAEAR